MQKVFYFNTGVRPINGAGLYGRQVWKDGTKQIPFTCNNVPNGAIFQFASDDPGPHPGLISREIIDNGPMGLLSKFAHFAAKRED